MVCSSVFDKWYSVVWCSHLWSGLDYYDLTLSNLAAMVLMGVFCWFVCLGGGLFSLFFWCFFCWFGFWCWGVGLYVFCVCLVAVVCCGFMVFGWWGYGFFLHLEFCFCFRFCVFFSVLFLVAILGWFVFCLDLLLVVWFSCFVGIWPFGVF